MSASSNARTRAARFAAAHPKLRTAAVTGTNGKTTTTSLIASIVAASGEPYALLTTVGAAVDGAPIPREDPSEEFLLTVEAAVDAGVRTLALEMTSKALAGGLAARWRPAVAVFTNLSRDHLDMHESPEAYLAAKAQLFLALPATGVAVLNRDDPTSALIDEVTPRGVTRRWFSVHDAGADLCASRLEVDAEGTRVHLLPSALADALGGSLELRLHGEVHGLNALAAALAADSLGYSPASIRAGLARFEGVPGRFWPVAWRPLVVVDYAHTPAALDGTLRTARRLCAAGGQVLLVFGCGGLRDRGKRPAMGAKAHVLADRVWLTNDNPRNEDPRAITDEIRAGVEGEGASWTLELDRGRAITAAVHAATPADVVIIAGKGHEQTQELREGSRRFSDLEVAGRAHATRPSDA